MSMVFLLAAAAAGLAIVGSLLGRSVAWRIGAIARPKSDRWNPNAIPLLGGPAVVLGVALTLPLAPELPPQIWVLLGGAVFLSIVGVIDDLHAIRPYSKLTAQLVAAGAVTALGLRFPLTGIPVVDIIVTMVWMVGLTNAFNLLDNMDGLAAGIAALAGLVKLTLFAMDGHWPGAFACAALVGASLGFLVFNFNPARIFMGDAGSMFLGFFIAGLSAVGGNPDSRAIASVLVAPVAVMLVPIFDTSFVTIMRVLARRPISEGGKDHTSHRLVKAGLSERRAVLVLYGLAIVAGLVAIVTRDAALGVGIVLLTGLAIIMLILGVALARIKVYPDVEAAPPGGVSLQRAPGLPYVRQIATAGINGVLVLVAYYAAYAFRYGTEVGMTDSQFLESLPIVFSCKMIALALFRGHRRLWRYTGTHDLVALVQASTVGSVLSLLAILFIYRFADYSRAVFALDWILLTALLASSRLLLRGLSEMLHPAPDSGVRVLIYGAGDGGVALLQELRRNPVFGRVVVGFMDDNVLKQQTRIQGMPVFGGIKALADTLRDRHVEEVIIATTRLSAGRLAQIREACDAAGVPVSQFQITIQGVPVDKQIIRTAS